MSRRSALAVASVAIATPASAALSTALPAVVDAAIIPINAAATHDGSSAAIAIWTKMQRILKLTDWTDSRALKTHEWGLHDALWNRYEKLGYELLDIPAQSPADILRKLEWGFPDHFAEGAVPPDGFETEALIAAIEDIRRLGADQVCSEGRLTTEATRRTAA